MNSPDVKRPPPAFFDLLAPTLVLLAPFVSVVKYHDYGLFRPEVALCLGALILVGLICGCVILLGGRPIKAGVMAFLLSLYADIQFPFFFSSVLNLVLTFSVFVLLSRLIIKHLSNIVVIVFGTILFSTLVLPIGKLFSLKSISTPCDASMADLPPIVHLVLDEHIGIEGIPPSIEGGSNLKEFLKSFYLRNGFRLFGGAYSESFITKDSLNQMFNFRNQNRGNVIESKDINFEFQMVRNEHFQVMSRKGYKIHVYQPDYMNFCADRSIKCLKCNTYQANTIKSIKESPWPLLEKTKALARYYLHFSKLHQKGRDLYYRVLYKLDYPRDWHERAFDWGRYRFSTTAGMAVFDRLKADLKNASRGDLFFAHLLVPHSPYAYDALCRLRSQGRWLSRKSIRSPNGEINSPETRAARYIGYFDQIRCIYRQLDELLRVLRGSRHLDDAVVIIHGDHGSRITLVDAKLMDKSRLSKSDYMDSFSTLFAIRSPDISPGYDLERISIQDLFASLVASDFRDLREPSE